MNTTATSLSSEHSWMKAGISRHSSMESVLSIQSKETAETHRLLVEAYNEAALNEKTCSEWFQKFKNDGFDIENKDCSGRPKNYEDVELEEDSSQTQKELALTLEVTQQAVSHRLKLLGIIHEQEFVRDTSDTDWTNDPDVEYEPVTEPEDEPANRAGDTSSDNDIITTKVVAVSVCDDGDLEFADSGTRAESGHRGGGQPKRKCKRTTANIEVNCIPQVRLLGDNPDSGVESNFNSQASSQELSQDILTPSFKEHDVTDGPGPSSQAENSETRINSIDSIGIKKNVILDDTSSSRKRRAGSVDRRNKRIKTKYSDSETDTGSEDSAIKSRNDDVKPLVKSVSDPALTIDDTLNVRTKAIVNTLKEKFDDSKENLCIVCFTKPKSGVFVHGRIAHICCCYKCAVKIWTQLKRCPVCNSKFAFDVCRSATSTEVIAMMSSRSHLDSIGDEVP
ncbi:Mariner Mos1 transposase [Eumeta japonica]|uniref:Mariner Mos1 transposase n=1 Tax=Eumeta variegata TaxID=151549 RepID=A0A4C1WRU1_EUMVA|nr:Mariner Mos1 transposase [Eumeta japonica]